MKSTKTWLLGAPLLLAAACGDSEETPPEATETPNIVQLAGGSSQLSTLSSLLGAADLSSALSGTGPFTVFAPTDAAFAKLPQATLDALAQDKAALQGVLKFHVVSGKVMAADVVKLSSATTLAGSSIGIRVEGSKVVLTDGQGNDSEITATDLAASNGVVHLIDTVLLPAEAQPQPGTIVEVARAAGFSSLIAAAEAAGLSEALSGAGPFTVFAPTDQAFQALAGAIPSDPGLLANILLHHVVPGAVSSSQVAGASPLSTLAGTQLEIAASGSMITVNGFELGSTLDVPASNGIIHVMNEVIVPPSILETAAATADLSTLVAAVGASSESTQAALAAEGPITVFAPINSAFAKIPSEALNALLADQPELDRVLAHHLATGQALAGELQDGQRIPTAAGQELVVELSNGSARLIDGQGNVVNIVATDLRLRNGVVHLIDGVLMPAPTAPSKNIVETAVEAGSFSTLLGAATAAGLADVLANSGPFTVFAPTDSAFDALGIDLTPVSVDVIANILLHHVVSGRFDSSAVVAAMGLDTLASTFLSVDPSSTPPTIGGSELSTSLDIAASNGIIHVMNEVIVPPTLLDVAQATSDLSTLVSAVGAASSATQGALAPNTLAGESPITVFAPTNAAFAASGIDLATVPQSALDAVLAHHVVGAQAVSSSLSDGQVVPTLNGNLTVHVTAGGAISLTDGQGNVANVIATLKDIRTLTGVVHVIDRVLLP